MCGIFSNKLINILFKQIDQNQMVLTGNSDREEKNIPDHGVMNNSLMVHTVKETIDEINIFNVEQTTVNIGMDVVMNIQLSLH